MQIRHYIGKYANNVTYYENATTVEGLSYINLLILTSYRQFNIGTRTVLINVPWYIGVSMQSNPDP